MLYDDINATNIVLLSAFFYMVKKFENLDNNMLCDGAKKYNLSLVEPVNRYGKQEERTKKLFFLESDPEKNTSHE